MTIEVWLAKHGTVYGCLVGESRPTLTKLVMDDVRTTNKYNPSDSVVLSLLFEYLEQAESDCVGQRLLQQTRGETFE